MVINTFWALVVLALPAGSAYLLPPATSRHCHSTSIQSVATKLQMVDAWAEDYWAAQSTELITVPDVEEAAEEVSRLIGGGHGLSNVPLDEIHHPVRLADGDEESTARDPSFGLREAMSQMFAAHAAIVLSLLPARMLAISNGVFVRARWYAFALLSYFLASVKSARASFCRTRFFNALVLSVLARDEQNSDSGQLVHDPAAYNFFYNRQ